jgi:hypothetical protein
MLETLKAADATKELGTAEEAGAEHADKMHISHRALHQILHLIGHVAGPEAGAALAGVGAAAMGSGGIMMAVMAVRELYQAFAEAKKQAEELKNKSAEAMAEVAKQADEATTKMNDAAKSVEDFWKGLNNKEAIAAVHEAFAAQLQQFSDIAAAAEKLGLIGKDQGSKFVENNDIKTKEERAAALEGSIAKLTEILGKISGDSEDAVKHRFSIRSDEKALTDMKERLALSKVMAESGNGQEKENAKGDVITLQNSVDAMQRNYDLRLKQDTDKTKELEETISRMTEEARTLRDSTSKKRMEQGTNDYATGLTYANKGAGATPNEQMFVQALEKQITGKNMTFDKAAALIKMQTANIETTVKILELHAKEVSKIQLRLDWLEQHHGT